MDALRAVRSSTGIRLLLDKSARVPAKVSMPAMTPSEPYFNKDGQVTHTDVAIVFLRNRSYSKAPVIAGKVKLTDSLLQARSNPPSQRRVGPGINAGMRTGFRLGGRPTAKREGCDQKWRPQWGLYLLINKICRGAAGA